jgi:hypothetical protein
MRHQPFVVDGIARVTAAKMIVDAALAHARQRKLGGEKKPIVFGACTGAPQEFKHRALRKFGRAAQAPIDRIGRTRNGCRRTVELCYADICWIIRTRSFGELRNKRIPVLCDLVRFIAKDARDFAQYVGKCDAAVLRCLRKICAAPERRAIGREKHRQWPAALLA